MAMPNMSLSSSDSSKQVADGKVFADLGNQFSSPFAVGRAASASAENSRSTDQAEGGGSTNWPLIIGAGAFGLIALVIVLKKL